MSGDLLAVCSVLIIFFSLILITNYLYNHAHWSSENSRKFLHASGGTLCLFSAQFFKSHWWILILCTVAFIVLLVTFIKKSMPSVHETRRVSFGSILFPIPIYICFFASKHWENDVFFYIPVSLLTFSDTLAELGGNKWGHSTLSFFRGQKTMAGSLCFAVSAFIICFVFLFYFKDYSLFEITGYCFLIVLISTLVELVTLKGFDNLTVPIAALLILFLIT